MSNEKQVETTQAEEDVQADNATIVATSPDDIEDGKGELYAKPEWCMLKGGVMVVGAELISDKLLGLVYQALRLDKDGDMFGVQMIRIRDDGHPKDSLGKAHLDSGSISINLQAIYDVCEDSVLNDGQRLAMNAFLQHQFMLTVLHEVNHIDNTRDPEYRELYESDIKAADDEAEEWAAKTIVDMAKAFDMEPPELSDEPFFSTRIMGMMTKHATNENVGMHAKLMADDIAYIKDDVQCDTYREWLRATYDPADKSKHLWDDPNVSTIKVLFEMSDGTVDDGADESDEPVVEEPVAEVKSPFKTDEEMAQDEHIQELIDAPAQEMSAGFALADEIITGEAGDTHYADDGPTIHFTIPEEAAAHGQEPVDPGQMAAAAMMGAGAGMNAAAPYAAEVTLPPVDFTVAPEVVQQVNATAAHANAPQGFQPQTQLQPLPHVTPQNLAAFLKDVYMRGFVHMYTKCGWNPQNLQAYFGNPLGMLEPVDITDLVSKYNCQGVIVGYDTVNAQGQYIREDFNGAIRGRTFNKSYPSGLPVYILYLNMNTPGGQEQRRKVIAQNPIKTLPTGQFKPNAIYAQQGYAIAWVAADDGFKAKIVADPVNRKTNYEVL